jgi:MioC protein
MQYISEIESGEPRVQQPVSILVGTMTGTAEMVADEIKAVLTAAGYPVEILPMDKLDARVFERPDVFIVCTSTYGQGDVPDNARDLFESLKSVRPDLSRIRYGVFGLGDSTYFDTYNNGGKQFDDLLSDLGAKRVGERMAHNASGDELPEDAGAAWAKTWVGLLTPLLVAAE